MKKIKRWAGVFLSAAVLAAGAAPTGAAVTRTSAEALMRSGKSMKCSVDQSEGASRQTGTIYLTRDRMRGEFDVTEPGQGSFRANVLQDGDWVYTWGGPMGEAQGVKMKVDRSGGAASGSEAFNSHEEMEMDCSEWSAEASRFEVPRNVQFMEMSGMGPGAAGVMGGDMQAMQCQACDQAPAGPERDMCRQMMGCR